MASKPPSLPAPVEPKLPDAEIIPRVEDVFDRWICGGIEALGKSSGVSLAFVLIACAIDYLAGFWKGRATQGDDYVDFLAAHPFFASKYPPKELYGSLRCGLVHNFTIHQGAYALTSQHPEQHLKRAKSGQLFLNLEDFYADFRQLKESVFKNAKGDQAARQRFIDRYRATGFVLFRTDIPI